jgi:hypothetical protein
MWQQDGKDQTFLAWPQVLSERLGRRMGIKAAQTQEGSGSWWSPEEPRAEKAFQQAIPEAKENNLIC